MTSGTEQAARNAIRRPRPDRGSYRTIAMAALAIAAHPAHGQHSGGPVVIDVASYGAKCDGANDDTSAIKAALGAARSRPSEVVVGGPCRVTGPLELGTKVHLRGTNGRAGLHASGVWRSALLVVRASGVTISDLVLDGSGARIPQLVKITNSDVRLQRVTVTGGGNYTYAEASADGALRPLAGVWIQGKRGQLDVSDVTIEDSLFTGNGAPDTGGHDIVANHQPSESVRVRILGNRVHGSRTAIAVALYDVSESTVEGNEIDQGNRSDEHTKHANLRQDDGYGILIYNTPRATAPCANNSIVNNRVFNTASSAIYLQGGANSVIRRNHIERACQLPDGAFVMDDKVSVGAIAANAGFPPSPEAVGIAIEANMIIGSGKNGISVANTRQAKVIGNIVRGVSKFGIDARNRESGLVIRENRIEGGALRGISLTGGTGGPEWVTSSHNVIDGAVDGIYVASTASHASIDGDHIKNCRSHGILAAGAHYTRIVNVRVSNSGVRGILVGGRESTVRASRVTGTRERGVGLVVGRDARRALIDGNVLAENDGPPFSDAGRDTVYCHNCAADPLPRTRVAP